jgi:nucleotide-binding universal stress UspA family protein
MFKQIIIGVDEHEAASDAIMLAEQLAAPSAQLTLAFVASSNPYVYRGVSALYDADERAHTLERLEEVRRQSGLDAEVRHIVARSTGRGLHELAEQEDADLLVVGSCRRGLIGRVLMGDETRDALNGAPCAVAIAPAGHAYEPDMIREIGVGYDESAESQHALETAHSIAVKVGARVSAMEVISLPRYMLRDGMTAGDISIEEVVTAAVERIAGLGGVEPHAVYGHVAEELALYSASVDLLVVGSRGYGPIGRLVHGSTSRELSCTARCPLLVLTRAAREKEARPGARSGREDASPTRA